MCISTLTDTTSGLKTNRPCNRRLTAEIQSLGLRDHWGDADECGEIVYNLALSHERPKATRDALIGMGVPQSQVVFATGWGKLYPTCTESGENCWSQNGRAHFERW